MTVAWCYKLTKDNRMVHVKKVNFMVCQLDLNKADENDWLSGK